MSTHFVLPRRPSAEERACALPAQKTLPASASLRGRSAEFKAHDASDEGDALLAAILQAEIGRGSPLPGTQEVSSAAAGEEALSSPRATARDEAGLLASPGKELSPVRRALAKFAVVSPERNTGSGAAAAAEELAGESPPKARKEKLGDSPGRAGRAQASAARTIAAARNLTHGYAETKEEPALPMPPPPRRRLEGCAVATLRSESVAKESVETRKRRHEPDLPAEQLDILRTIFSRRSMATAASHFIANVAVCLEGDDAQLGFTNEWLASMPERDLVALATTYHRDSREEMIGLLQAHPDLTKRKSVYNILWFILARDLELTPKSAAMDAMLSKVASKYGLPVFWEQASGGSGSPAASPASMASGGSGTSGASGIDFEELWKTSQDQFGEAEFDEATLGGMDFATLEEYADTILNGKLKHDFVSERTDSFRFKGSPPKADRVMYSKKLKIIISQDNTRHGGTVLKGYSQAPGDKGKWARYGSLNALLEVKRS